MTVTKVQCERCGSWISKQNYSRHVATHDKPIRVVEKPKSDYNQDQDGLFCRFCGEPKKNKNSLRQHEIRCRENPDRIASCIKPNFNNKGRTAWNKGLTKDDPRIAKGAAKYKEKVSRAKDDLELELDDDGKLFTRWVLKKSNAKIAGVRCLLTFHEYCLLVKEAGLKSSDLGYSGNKYDLARIGDAGDYIYGRCRFITHQENSRERKVSDKARESARESARKHWDKVKEAPSLNHLINSPGMKAYQEARHEAALKKEKEYLANRDIHNSQFGTFWITNGIENKKWKDEKGDIPQGFYKGRVLSKKDG